MNNELLHLCDQVVAAAANGMCQGILVALVVGLGLRLLGRTNAATRHAIWFATLLLLAALIPAQFLRGHSPGIGSAAPPHKNGFEPAAFAPGSGPEPNGAAFRPGPSSISSFSLDSISPSRGSRQDGELAESPTVVDRQPATIKAAAPAIALEPPGPDRPDEAYENHGVALPASRGSHQEKPGWLDPAAWSFSAHLPRLATLMLLAAWVIGAGLKTTLLAWRLIQIRKLKANAVPAGSNLQALFQSLRRQLSVLRPVELKVSPVHRSPVLLGFGHPVVLLPAAEPSETAETEAVLRHELAHVRRRDDWANLGQHLIQALLFFHPAVWWISRHLSVQREIACDDCVLHQSGRPRAYALLLADLASRIKTQRPLLAPGVTTSKSQLQQRIDMILNTRRNTSPRLAKSRLGFVTSAAALLAALTIYSAPRLVLAQAPPTPPTPEPPAVNALPGTFVEPTAPTPPAAPVQATEPELPTSRNTAPAIAPGPKTKPENRNDYMPPSVSLAPRATQASSGVVVVRPDKPKGPDIVVVPRAALAPRPPRAPEPVSEDSSIEQRLRRLEKLVNSLLEQKELKTGSSGLVSKDGAHVFVWRDSQELQKLQDRAQREAARQRDQAKRAAREAEKAVQMRSDLDAAGKLNENFDRQIEALQKQREALEREVQNMEHQIQQLEQQRQKLLDEQNGRSQLLQEKSADRELMGAPQAPCAEGAVLAFLQAK